MKKAIFILTITTFMAGSVLVGCQSSTKKEEAAQENVQEAQEDLMDAQNEVAVQEQKAATAEEWQDFKNKTNATIDANETRIAQFKVNMKSTGKSADAIYLKKIEALEQKNKDLKVRMNAYKNDTNSDWSSFKREFNHDMDELGTALKDLTVDNKK
jgi:ethanolamine ammonia-lyase small subunit